MRAPRNAVLVLVAACCPLGLGACGKVIGHDAGSYIGPDIKSIAHSVTETADAEQIIKRSLSGDELAQSFKPLNVKPLQFIQVKLKRVGATTATSSKITMTIEADSSGVPSGTPVATGTLPVSERVAVSTSTFTIKEYIDTTSTWYRISFAETSVKLDPTLTYWLRLKADNESGSIYWMATTTDTYTDGSAVGETAAANTWTSTTISPALDFLFVIVGEG